VGIKGIEFVSLEKSQFQIMKKELNIILAGSVGLFAVLGIISFRKILKSKNFTIRKEHELYGNRYQNEDEDGVEFLALL